MADSNRVENQIFDKSFIKKELNQHLSLQLSATRLKAVWFDIPSKTYIGFQYFELINSAWDVIKKELIKNLNYQSVSLSLINNKYTLVPKGLFNEQNKADFLDFNHGEFDSEISFDSITSQDAILVYALNNELINSIKHDFPGIKIQHACKSLIEAISNDELAKDKCLFVNIQENSFDISLIRQKKLYFFNSFTYKTTEDFIYFLLYVMEQLDLDRETCKLKLSGEFEENSTIYQTIFKYIRNVNIVDRPLGANYSLVLNNIPKQYHYNLFNQYLCE